MRHQQIEKDIFLVTGETYQANATVIINGGGEDALLIDGLASSEDAAKLRSFIERELQKSVKLIVSTHYMSDHIAAFRLFPAAILIAHKNYLQTFNSQKSLTEEEKSFFVKPTIEIFNKAVINWGGYKLRVFHNQGKTASSLNVDIAEADLLIVGDEIFGNTAFLSSAGTPDTMRRALLRLKNINRNRIIPGHIGLFDRTVLDNAEFYLDSLEKQVEAARRSPDGENSILNIQLKDCLADHVAATNFEDEFHRINLKLIVERKLFKSGSEKCLN